MAATNTEMRVLRDVEGIIDRRKETLSAEEAETFSQYKTILERFEALREKQREYVRKSVSRYEKDPANKEKMQEKNHKKWLRKKAKRSKQPEAD